MLLHLRLRERRENPPTFLKLLNEIKEEEENEMSHHKLNTVVRPVRVNVDTKTTEVPEFKAELRELCTYLAELTAKKSDGAMCSTSKTERRCTESEQSDELQRLKLQVRQLQEQLTVMSVSHSPLTQPFWKNERQGAQEVAGKRLPSTDSEDYFCYRFGEVDTSPLDAEVVRILQK